MNATPPPGYKKVSDWVNKTIETTSPLRNGNMEVPVGTRCEVTYARKGLTLKTNPCPHCGVHVYITNVGAYDVRLVQTDDQPQPRA